MDQTNQNNEPVAISEAEPMIERLAMSMRAAGLAPRTILGYSQDLRKLFGRSGMLVKPLASVTRDDFDILLDGMRRDGLASTTIARNVAAIRAFWRFLLERKVIQDNPAEGIRVKCKRQFNPTVLDEAETDRLLQAIRMGAFRGDREAVRDLAIVTLMVRRGLRVSEVAALDHQDIQDEHHILIHEKGGKRAIKALDHETSRILMVYLAGVGADPEGARTGPLFLGHTDERISIGRIEERVALWSERAGRRVTPHALRHTFATVQLRKTKNVPLVQKLLGHRSYLTTLRYLHVNEQDIEIAMGLRKS